MGVYVERTAQFTSLGAVLTEITMADIPRCGLIRRIRANVSAGTAINTVQLQFRTAAGGAWPTTIFAYALTANPLDSGPLAAPFFYRLPLDTLGGVPTGFGDAILAAAVDDATADHTVDVQLTIEAPADQAYGDSYF